MNGELSTRLVGRHDVWQLHADIRSGRKVSSRDSAIGGTGRQRHVEAISVLVERPARRTSPGIDDDLVHSTLLHNHNLLDRAWRCQRRDRGRRERYCARMTRSNAPNAVYELIPELGRLRDEVLFGDVWEQESLTKRDRSLVTITVLAALYRTPELKGHLNRALDNGVTETEIKGMITHVAFYAGWPCAVNAGRVLLEVLDER